jgi:hypothetical protein
MSNYYYKTAPISTVIKYITDSSTYNSFASFAPLNTSYTSNFSNDINEKPNTLNYTYQNTDISNFCIANYVDGTSTATENIPTGAVSARIILIGGGGGGSTGQIAVNGAPAINVSQNYYQGVIRSYYYNPSVSGPGGYPGLGPSPPPELPDYDNDGPWGSPGGGGGTYYFHQHHHAAIPNVQAKGGASGGGGGFVHFTIPLSGLTTIPVTVGSGGSANKNGGDTTITVNSVTYKAGGGGGSTNLNSAGSASTSSCPGYTLLNEGSFGFPASGSNGSPGAANGITTYLSPTSSFPSYGKGGAGGDNSNPGNSGNSGYYKIYYLF